MNDVSQVARLTGRRTDLGVGQEVVHRFNEPVKALTGITGNARVFINKAVVQWSVGTTLRKKMTSKIKSQVYETKVIIFTTTRIKS